MLVRLRKTQVPVYEAFVITSLGYYIKARSDYQTHEGNVEAAKKAFMTEFQDEEIEMGLPPGTAETAFHHAVSVWEDIKEQNMRQFVPTEEPSKYVGKNLTQSELPLGT